MSASRKKKAYTWGEFADALKEEMPKVARQMAEHSERYVACVSISSPATKVAENALKIIAATYGFALDFVRFLMPGNVPRAGLENLRGEVNGKGTTLSKPCRTPLDPCW